MDDDALVEAFLDTLWLERGASDNTLGAYRSDLTAWRRWLADQAEAGADTEPLLSVAPQQVQAFCDSRRESHALRSTARLLSALRRFYRWALAEGMIEADPLHEVRSTERGCVSASWST